MIFEKDGILVGKGESLQQMMLEQSICKTKIYTFPITANPIQ